MPLKILQSFLTLTNVFFLKKKTCYLENTLFASSVCLSNFRDQTVPLTLNEAAKPLPLKTLNP